MVTLGRWFLLKPFWLVVLSSIAGAFVGILLRRFMKKEKLLSLFLPLLLYLLAEYMSAEVEQGGITWTVLGGMSAMLFLGVVLPSALIPWNVKW